MQPVNELLLAYLLDPGTEFHKKYFGLAARSHSPEAMSAFREAIVDFFTTRLDEKRALLGLEIIHYVFRENDMEGLWEIFQFLTRKELSGDFFRTYRDHTTHQVLVFFLGCLLYEKVGRFQDLYHEQHIGQSGPDLDPLKTGFFYQWSCIALFHDFGYFFDVHEPLLSKIAIQRSDIERSKTKRSAIASFFRFFEKYFNSYLERQYRYWSKSDLDARTLALINRFQEFALPKVDLQYRNHLDSRLISDLRVAGKFVSLEPIDGFDLLESFCEAYVPKACGTLGPYFNALNERGAPYSSEYIRVWDHGIASALIFLKVCAFGFKVTDVMKALGPAVDKLDDSVKMIAGEFERMFSMFDYRKAIFDKTVTCSALAMALHNLRPVKRFEHFDAARYEPRDLRVFDLIETKVFPIHAEEYFLGYLLLIVDQLQDWDRYRIVRTGDMAARQTIEGRHLKIAVNRGKVVICFEGPSWVGDRYSEISSDLTALTSEPGNFLDLVYERR